MRRSLALASAGLFLFAGVANAAAPTGTLAVVGSTATTVTLYAEQTGGDPVKLTIRHYCYVGDNYASDSIFAGSDQASFTGSATVTFDIGPRKVKGKTLTPDNCFAYIMYQMPSQTALVLAGVDTL